MALGKCYYRLGMFREAEKQFKSALKQQVSGAYRWGVRDGYLGGREVGHEVVDFIGGMWKSWVGRHEVADWRRVERWVGSRRSGRSVSLGWPHGHGSTS